MRETWVWPLGQEDYSVDGQLKISLWKEIKSLIKMIVVGIYQVIQLFAKNKNDGTCVTNIQSAML